MTDWYETHIDAGVRDLVRLLRDNGWNTSSCCDGEYDGLIIIECYGEQGGEALGNGKTLMSMLKWLLWDNGYKDFTIEHRLASSGTREAEEFIILKMGQRAIDAVFGAPTQHRKEVK